MKNLSGIFAVASMMAFAVWVLGLLLPDNWPYWVCLVVQLPFGIMVYFLPLHTLKMKAYVDIRKFLSEQWRLRFVKAVGGFTA